MQLSEIQTRFRDLMLDHPDALQALPNDFAAVFDEKDIALNKRLAVYRNNIVGSITDLVVTTFPILEKLVGKEFLEGMARTFVLQRPPTQGYLSCYGTGFDDFIAHFKPAESLPYLADVARLELAMNEAYYARDEQPMNAEDLAAIPPDALETTHFRLCDHVKIHAFDYPVDAIKAFCESNDPNAQLDLNAGGVKIMVHRPNLNVDFLMLENDEFELLQLLNNKALGEAVTEIMTAYPNFNFQNFLQKHLSIETFLKSKQNIAVEKITKTQVI